MAIDKSHTSPFVKGVIIFVAITFVLGIAGTAFVPLLESIFSGNTSGTATTPGSATATDTVAAISAKYSGRIQGNDDKLKTDAKNYATLLDQAQAYHDWANDVSQATKRQGATDRPLWLLAVDFYGKALAVKSGDPNVMTDMAIAQFYSGDAQGALATGLAVAKANPKFAQVYFNLGVFYSALNDNAKAIAAYQSYVRLDPNGGQQVTEANARIATLKAAPSTTTSTTP